jgi:hypothetical protein
MTSSLTSGVDDAVVIGMSVVVVVVVTRFCFGLRSLSLVSGTGRRFWAKSASVHGVQIKRLRPTFCCHKKIYKYKKTN